jgi:hypothetical protein
MDEVLDSRKWGILKKCSIMLREGAIMNTNSRRTSGRVMCDVEFEDCDDLAAHFAARLSECEDDPEDNTFFLAKVISGPLRIPIAVGASGAKGLSIERIDNDEGYSKANTIALPRALNGARQFNGQKMHELLVAAQKPLVTNAEEAKTILSVLLYRPSPFLDLIQKTMRGNQKKRGMEAMILTKRDIIGVAVKTGLRCRISMVGIPCVSIVLTIINY